MGHAESCAFGFKPNQGSKAQGMGFEFEKASTLNTQNSCGGGILKAYAICSFSSNCMKSDNPHSGIYEAETSRTLDLNGGNPACNQGGLMIVDDEEYIVRRLTPLECERLQGFPDGWTDIGDWVDSKGKKHKGDSDAPRYKALGNSIALPFWKWMFRNMAQFLPKGATMGSLFDGIGGFPLCWEEIHGNGTARWASEIEEFPIAVTKERFGEE